MYDILSSRNKDKLIAMVNERLADGWKRVGSHVNVVYEEEVGSYESEPVIRTTGNWSQAMELDIKVGYTRVEYVTGPYTTEFVLEVTREGEIYLNVVARHRLANRKSTINTMNYMLSMFEIDEDDNRFEMESDWKVEKSELARFVRAIESAGVDTYLCDALDEDYELGGWNSNSKED